MSKKNRYRAIWLENLDVERLSAAIEGVRVVVGIDIAKEEQFAAVMDASQHVHATIKWRQPAQTRDFVAWMQQLSSEFESVEIAMEPSGTYGDALRSQLLSVSLPVFRVSPKRSHDAAEVYDGVPSLHDAKSAAIIAKLHLDDASRSGRSMREISKQDCECLKSTVASSNPTETVMSAMLQVERCRWYYFLQLCWLHCRRWCREDVSQTSTWGPQTPQKGSLSVGRRNCSKATAGSCQGED